MVPSLDVDPPHPVWYPRHSLKKELSERRPLSFICKLEDPIAARKAELCRKVRRARARQAPATSQNEAEQSYEAEDDGAGESERTTRAGRPRGGMNWRGTARIGERGRDCERCKERKEEADSRVQYNYLSRVVDLPPPPPPPPTRLAEWEWGQQRHPPLA